jgi:predicted ATPase
MEGAAGLTELWLQNFKSVGPKRQRLVIRPLTVIAGANSSGKSTLMQPWLLLKQSWENAFEPRGLLLLEGPHVSFTEVEQFLSLVPGSDVNGFQFGFGNQFEIGDYATNGEFGRAEVKYNYELERGLWRETISRWVCLGAETSEPNVDDLDISEELLFKVQLSGLLHVPGLRGRVSRQFPRTALGTRFRGPFEPYMASAIQGWQESSDERLSILRRWLEELELTSTIEARVVNDVAIELNVGRFPRSKATKADTVSLADVGIGVSQVLPGLVALLAANTGHTVYIEQPELHLHPNPQVKLAGILAEASKFGARIIVETHSSLLVREIQTLVAEGKLDPADVSLNWCSRDPETGATVVSQAELGKDGTYGEWPIDFDNIALESEGRFLDAVSLSRNR